MTHALGLDPAEPAERLLDHVMGHRLEELAGRELSPTRFHPGSNFLNDSAPELAIGRQLSLEGEEPGPRNRHRRA